MFADVDLIVHAGDVGGQSVLKQLRAIARVEAVLGNVDDPADPDLASERTLQVGGLTLHVSHGHELGSPAPRLVLARYDADILVFGHTHRSIVQLEPGGNARPVLDDAARSPARPAMPARLPHRGPRLVVNPGAAGPRRFNLPASVGRLTVDRGRAAVEIIEL